MTGIIRTLILALVLGVTPISVSAGVPTNYEVELALKKLGLPTGKVDGVWDDRTRRATCVWREITGATPVHKFPNWPERSAIMATTQLPVPSPIPVGLNINLTCQTLTWVHRAEGATYRKIKGVFPVSTGMFIGSTPVGKFKIIREIDGWHESTLYPEAWMYRPKYITDVVAIHGSATDALVKDYPASHGCIRIRHAHLDRLWKNNIGIGTRVAIYGDWAK